MAFDPLATTADLAVRGITVPDEMDALTLLKSASEAVRDAAGVPISQVTSTITLRGDFDSFLALPGGPLVSVASITQNGEAVTDYTILNGMLYREAGWRFWLDNFSGPTPAAVTITYTHGLAEVPEDIVDLVCSLVAQRAAQGYDNDPRVTSESIDDYRVSFAERPVVIPDLTRQWLRDRFSGNAYTTGVRW